MAINDQDHQMLKSLLRRAYDGDSSHERRHALEDACKLVGVKFYKSFVHAEGMHENGKPHAGDDVLKQVILDSYDEAVAKGGLHSPLKPPKACVR